MAPMQKKVENKGGRKKEMIMVQVKKDIIKKYKQGMQVAKIARFYKKSTFASYLQRRRRKRPRNLSFQMRVKRCVKCGEKFVEKHHPNMAVAV